MEFELVLTIIGLMLTFIGIIIGLVIKITKLEECLRHEVRIRNHIIKDLAEKLNIDIDTDI